jgi:hypothetical protein
MIFKWVFPQKLAIFVIFNFFQKISILILHLTTLTANPLEIWGILLITPLLSTSKHTFGHYEIWPSGENLKNQGSIFFFAKLPRGPATALLWGFWGPYLDPRGPCQGPFIWVNDWALEALPEPCCYLAGPNISHQRACHSFLSAKSFDFPQRSSNVQHSLPSFTKCQKKKKISARFNYLNNLWKIHIYSEMQRIYKLIF